MVGRVGLVLGLVVTLGGAAAADPPTVAPPPVVDSDQKLVPAEKIDRGPGWSWRLAEKMTLAGDELSLSLRALTFDTMDVKFDGHTRRARMRMSAGKTDSFSLGFDSDIDFKAGYASVDATVHLAVMGRSYDLDVPRFDVVPRSYEGERYVELRVPVIDFKF
jgi:hypothetical protein